MRRREVLNRPLNWGSSRAIYDTVLESHCVPTGVTAVPCRVCGRMIAVGDHCLANRHLSNFACVTCGWWKLDELQTMHEGKSFRELMTLEPGKTVSREQAAKLVELGLIEREGSKLRWTDGGRRLAAEWRAQAFETLAKVGG